MHITVTLSWVRFQLERERIDDSGASERRNQARCDVEVDVGPDLSALHSCLQLLAKERRAAGAGLVGDGACEEALEERACGRGGDQDRAPARGQLVQHQVPVQVRLVVEVMARALVLGVAV